MGMGGGLARVDEWVPYLFLCVSVAESRGKVDPPCFQGNPGSKVECICLSEGVADPIVEIEGAVRVFRGG